MTVSLTPDFQPSIQQNSSMAFSGAGREFLKLLLKGSLLQIPTFGFYRFWLITKLRRHLWANTRIGGEAFEYTGTAKELLVGFLIALAVLTPFYAGYFLLGIWLEEMQALASVPLILIIYVLAHFGSYRARKYRASRTVFRGVRFWMKGSGWAYAFRAILWDLATLLTLGLALPWAMASLERYRMRHTYFGTVQGRFAGTGWTLFKRGWWLWALGWAIVIAPFVLIGAMGLSAEEMEGHAVLQLMPLFIVLVFFSILPLSMAVFTRWQMEGVRLGDVAVSTTMGNGAFYGLFLKWFFSSIGFLIAVAVVVGIGAAAFGSAFQEAFQDMQNESLTSTAIGAAVLIALVYLVMLLGMGIIQRYFLGRGLWALIVNSITVSNLHAIDAAVAAGQPAGVLGEGLADALDFNVSV